DKGVTYEEKEIPNELQAECQKWHDNMVEAAAEADETLMEKYLENGQLSVEEIKRGLRKRTISNEIVPMLCGSAFKNKGVQALLDAVIDYLPAPNDVPPIKGILDDKEESEGERWADDSQPFSALVFKIATDPFVGTLSFFRVYSGVLKSGDSVYNPVKRKKER